MASSQKSGSPTSGTVTVVEGGVITRVSRAVQQLCGVEAQELIGHSIKLLLPSERARLQDEMEYLLEQAELSKRELRHRVVNSLQMIAGILMMNARKVESEEARLHIEDAHLRIIALAEIQKHLEIDGHDDAVDIIQYLTKLCASLELAMIHGRPLTLEVRGQCDRSLNKQVCVALGLITTELIINALKYAFQKDMPGAITVSFTSRGEGWELAVADNGIGTLDANLPGLGRRIIDGLAKQLNATITRSSQQPGTIVSILSSQ